MPRTKGKELAKLKATIKRLHRSGYSSPRIGEMLALDHTTVLWHLGVLKKKVYLPGEAKPPRVKTAHGERHDTKLTAKKTWLGGDGRTYGQSYKELAGEKMRKEE